MILRRYPDVPDHDPESAIRWVERAMKLGVADAYDLMGIYHQNRLIRGGNATSAYSFFQRAADMGSPAALTFLGDKCRAPMTPPTVSFGENLPVGIRMMECALAQGYGPAADKLSYIYRATTPESKLRALLVLQQGVRLGCSDCAINLSTEFNGYALKDGRNLVGYIDKARAQRYRKLADVLEHYEGRLKLPNRQDPPPAARAPSQLGRQSAIVDRRSQIRSAAY